jgi:adenylate cyclase
MFMSESFIPASEFETASNAVSNILGQPVEEIKITDILPPLNDIADSNKVFKGKLSVLFVDMRKSTDLTDELKSKKMVKVYRSFIRIVIQADIHDNLPVTELWASFRIAMWTTKIFLHLVKQ